VKVSCAWALALTSPAIVGGCATREAAHPAAVATAAESPPRLDTPARKLPNMHFPNTELLAPLEGRVLIEFRIDKDGKIISPTVLRAEAAPALQNAALKLVQRAKVNVKDKNFDASDTRGL
jgi:TonB family protein